MGHRPSFSKFLPCLILPLGCSNGTTSSGGETTDPRETSAASTPTASAPDAPSSSTPPTGTPSSNGPDSVVSHVDSQESSEPPDPASEVPNGSTTDGASTSAGDASSAQPPAETPCTLTASAELSAHIATVGLVTFETDLGSVDGGYVEFGTDTTYGQEAPIDWTAPDHETVLIGMRPGTEYHYRVVAQAGDKQCTSADRVLTTGPAPTDLPMPQLRASGEGEVMPGYVVTSAQATGGNGGGYYMVIYDHLGSPVWWYRSSIGGLVTRAKLSWDGKHVYGRDGNPSARSGGQVVRVAIDGSSEESLTVDTGHHDLAVTADNGVLFLVGGGGDECSRVEKWSANDEVSDLYDLRDAFGDSFKTGSDPCHCNSIHYNPDDESISVSCLTQNAYVKLSKDAELLWVLGGNNGQSHFTGDIAWDRQHGHHVLGPNRILFLNNNGGGDSTSKSSLAVELELNLDDMTATRVWEYDGGEVTQTLGDVQRLGNGNTLVTYCNAGILHEVNADKQIVQSWQFSNGVGYADHRPSLYGAPVRP